MISSAGVGRHSCEWITQRLPLERAQPLITTIRDIVLKLTGIQTGYIISPLDVVLLQSMYTEIKFHCLKIRPKWILETIFNSFLTCDLDHKNILTNSQRFEFRAPFCSDSQPFLVFLQPALAVPAGQMIECSFLVLLHFPPF